jgi:hypothetical protein
MSLPRVIEYLLAQNMDAPLVQEGFNQTVAIIPPGFSISLTNTPLGNNFALIVYQAILDPRMMPDAFAISLIFSGNKILSGTINGWVTQNQIDGFVVMSNSRPGTINIQNVTNLNQMYNGAIWYITISTHQQWLQVLDALERLGSTDADALADNLRNGGKK